MALPSGALARTLFVPRSAKVLGAGRTVTSSGLLGLEFAPPSMPDGNHLSALRMGHKRKIGATALKMARTRKDSRKFTYPRTKFFSASATGSSVGSGAVGWQVVCDNASGAVVAGLR